MGSGGQAEKEERMNLTVDDVRVMVSRLEGMDSESAHSHEDDIYETVLRAIVDGHSDPIGLATAALQSKELEFERWYA